MTDLKERLDHELSGIAPAVGARAAVDRRIDRRKRRRRLALPVVTLLVTGGIVTALTYAFAPGPPRGPADSAVIALPGEPFQAIVDGDALWVLTSEPGCDGPVCAGFVVKIDTIHRVVTVQVPVTSPTGLTAGAGSIWLASFADATLIRLDPETGRVEATIPLVLPGEEPGSDWEFLPTNVDANEEGVWVSTARGAVAHIDPATNEVVAVIPLPPESLGGVAIGREGIWLDNGLGGVIRVDPETHEVEEEGSIDDEVGRRLSVGTPVARGGSVWMVGNWARPVEELGEKAYEATEREALVEIDERTGEVASILDLPKEATWASLLEDRDVWLVEGDGASLRRLDLVTGQLGELIPVPFGRPLAVSGSIAWSAAGSSIRSWPIEFASSDSAEPPTRTDVSALMGVHRRLEATLSDLWEAEAYLDELRGEIEAAREGLDYIRRQIGSGKATPRQRFQMRQERELIRRFTLSALARQAEVSSLRAEAELQRTRRSDLLPPEHGAVLPDVATITCDGDAAGGTHVSFPVVRTQSDGVHIRVLNRISNERVFLSIEPDGRTYPVSGGATAAIIVPSAHLGDVQIVCTYVHSPESWERPAHPLWVARGDD